MVLGWVSSWKDERVDGLVELKRALLSTWSTSGQDQWSDGDGLGCLTVKCGKLLARPRLEMGTVSL